jgi:hypothetical protein
MQEQFLLERILRIVGDRVGYYVVAETEKGLLSLHEAYAIWEEEMQGEVMYFDCVRTRFLGDSAESG